MTGRTKPRGVLYVVWNKTKDKQLEACLRRSMQSVIRHHPELGIKVHELPPGATLLDKSRMFEWSPFEETLYLDADTMLLGRLDYAFEQALQHRLALSICEAPYARRYAQMIGGDVVEYNTGVMFFRRDDSVRALFAEWERLAFSEDSSNYYLTPEGVLKRQVCNDQASFAKAVHTLRFNPFVLPCNWNFRPYFIKDFFGPIKIWHDYPDPPPGMIDAHAKLSPDSVLCFGRVE